MQNQNDLKRRDAIRGSLLGGAIGDALGYAVEFLNEQTIFARYGDVGIQAFETDPCSGKALISDDTQMTLFTANGILLGCARAVGGEGTAPLTAYVAEAYQDWLRTQTTPFLARRSGHESGADGVCWLADVPELYNRRAPGNTCLSALQQARRSGALTADNHSKGCGGVMRVAPMGLVNIDVGIEQADRYGAAFAAITHGHPLGFLPAAALVHIVRRIVYARNGQTLRQIVQDARDTLARLYAGESSLGAMTAILDLAIELSENADDDLQNVHRLGEGWVGEEALAIAVYCALRHQNDFSAGIIAAVNHAGDSDSTGAVAGNVLGAWLGYEAIAPKWKTDLELRDVLLEMADDLDRPGELPGWQRKYAQISRKAD